MNKLTQYDPPGVTLCGARQAQPVLDVIFYKSLPAFEGDLEE